MKVRAIAKIMMKVEASDDESMTIVKNRFVENINNGKYIIRSLELHEIKMEIIKEAKE